jgi:hypothetical protein
MVDKPGLHALSHFTNIRCRPQSKLVKWRILAAFGGRTKPVLVERDNDIVSRVHNQYS